MILLCHALIVDWIVVGFIGLEAVLITVAAAVALSRGRTLDAIADQLADDDRSRGADHTGEALVDRAARLRRRATVAEFALDQRLGDLAYLADLIGVGIVRLTVDLRVEVANTAAHIFLQRPAGSMLGRTAIEAIGDHRIEAIAREAAERGAAAGEVSLRDPDGPALVIRARRSPILGIWLVLEDVAELRRLQRIRAEFIDNLSHELRTPITTIGLLAETLAKDAEGAGDAIPARMADRIGKLEAETATVGQMITELLDLARIESGGRKLHLDDVDLGRVAEDTVERLRPFAERQHVQLETTVAPDLPFVSGEASQLGQVIANLLHNAVKFSPPQTSVRVSVQRVGDELQASVRDQGVGVSATDLPRIFERFYKADRSRTSGGGTGLGLAIARHVIEGHGGRIAVESVEHEGATFTITLPIAGTRPADLSQGA